MKYFISFMVYISVVVLELEAVDKGFKRKADIIGVNTKYDEKGPLKMYTSIRKFNRTHTGITMNCTLTEKMDHHFRFKLEVQLWGDGGWKRNLVRYENNNPCEQLKLTIGTPWKNILKTVNVSEKCPFQPGFYHAEDLFVDISTTPLYMGTGRFKTIIDIFKMLKWMFKAEVEVIITDYF